MTVDDVALNHLAGADTAVVGALRSRVAVVGPSVRAVVEIEESVLLLETCSALATMPRSEQPATSQRTEPGLVFRVELHELGALMAVVELIGGSIGIPALGEDENVRGA